MPPPRNTMNKPDNCLFCDVLRDEYKRKRSYYYRKRMIFVAFYALFHTISIRHVYCFKKSQAKSDQFSETEKENLADILKKVTGTFDALFDYPFPYMMCMHQTPVNSEDASDYYHFHIEFFPPMRSADKQKFNASFRNRRMGTLQPNCTGRKSQRTACSISKNS